MLEGILRRFGGTATLARKDAMTNKRLKKNIDYSFIIHILTCPIAASGYFFFFFLFYLYVVVADFISTINYIFKFFSVTLFIFAIYFYWPFVVLWGVFFSFYFFYFLIFKNLLLFFYIVLLFVFPY